MEVVKRLVFTTSAAATAEIERARFHNLRSFVYGGCEANRFHNLRNNCGGCKRGRFRNPQSSDHGGCEATRFPDFHHCLPKGFTNRCTAPNIVLTSRTIQSREPWLIQRGSAGDPPGIPGGSTAKKGDPIQFGPSFPWGSAATSFPLYNIK